jgi:uncharacterized phosphosugar-binding protein
VLDRAGFIQVLGIGHIFATDSEAIAKAGGQAMQSAADPGMR